MKTIFLSILTLVTMNANAQKDTLYVYGPGGPFAAINECAQTFFKQTGQPVKVTAGPEDKWLDNAKKNAGLFYGGSEYMMTQFEMNHPELTAPESRTELYKREAGILVRPSNPKNIHSLKDLAAPGVRILDVNGAGQLGMWEDLAGRLDLIAGIQKNIKKSYANSALGIAAWKDDDSYDAWITYSSWHYPLKEITALVKIPKDQTVMRGTPLVLSSNTAQRQAAEKFITFLKSEEGHGIFRKWGWE